MLVLKLSVADPSRMPTGYLDFAYLESLQHIGEPVRLTASGAWLLRRPIATSGLHDCIGSYPLFFCERWLELRDDLAELRRGGIVSVTIVPDPFGEYSQGLLESLFDVVRVTKQRWVVDLRRDVREAISAHHLRRAQRALVGMEVERCEDPRQHAQEWGVCYRTFVERRGIAGAAAFAARDLESQLSVPGLVMYRARSGDRTLGFSLWMVHGACAYGHLAAYTEEGREAGAAYASQLVVLEDLQTRGVHRVDLGGGVDEGDGLERWKAGWTRDSRPSLVCGAILRPDEYSALTLARASVPTSYFPAYRAPESL
jgi:hypothetical protein